MRDQLTEHEYDGIREYDNPCPGWWHALIWVSIVFSFVYFLVFHLHSKPTTMIDFYDAAVAADLRHQFASIGNLSPDESTLIKYMHDEKWLKVGQQVFKGNCVSCHGVNAEGLVGPNLTDDLSKNINGLTDIPRVVAEGLVTNGMPAWKTRLHPNEVVLVSAYVASLRGQNLSGKNIAGEKPVPPWPTEVAIP